MKKSYFFFLILFLLGPFSLIAQEEFSLISWNIQDFGKTKDESEIRQIAQILEDFDIVALQEVVAGYGGSQAVARLADQLNRSGEKWDYRISNPTDSPKYKTERYAFLWKSNKVKLIGRPQLASDYAQVINREPYVARFRVGTQSVLVMNYHARRFDEDPAVEIRHFPEIVLDYPEDNILIAGDFNLRQEEMAFITLKYMGYEAALMDQKTTLKRKCTPMGEYLNHPIDNIFFNARKIQFVQSRAFDFVRHCDRLNLARKLSDHLPVWLVFMVP